MTTSQPYLMTILVHPQASTRERDEVLSLIQSWVEERSGTVQQMAHEQKRRLAYPIQHHHQASFTTLTLSLIPTDLTDLQEKIRRQKKVLRFTIQKFIPRTNEKTLKDAPLRPVAADKAAAAGAQKKEKAPLKELGEKIEEILEEEVL